MTTRKNDLEAAKIILKQEMDEYPCFNEAMVATTMNRMRTMIKSKTVEYLRPVILLLIKEIRLTKDEVQVVLNLNAYITGNSNKDLEVIIVEEAENIRNLDNQLKQRLNWSSLIIRI